MSYSLSHPKSSWSWRCHQSSNALAREVAERGATSNADNIDSKENALHVLMAALQATIWESSDVKQVLSFPERRRILSLIESTSTTKTLHR